GHVDELTIAEPLALPETGNVRLQITIGEADTEGRRDITIHSRREDTQSEWTCHATGVLGGDADKDGARSAAEQPEFAELAQWALSDAEAVDVDAFYERFEAQGLSYGPAFRGITGLWRRGGSAFALVRLPEGLDESEFGVHPALLDAALQSLAAVRTEDPASQSVLLPFEWSAAQLHRTGATELRVRADWDQESAEAHIRVADASGTPVAEARLKARLATVEQIRAGRPIEHLYQVALQPVPLPGVSADAARVRVLGGTGELAGVLGASRVADLDELFAQLQQDDVLPALLVVDATPEHGTDSDPAHAAHEASAFALDVLRRTFDEPRLAATELVWVTRRAYGEGAQDLAHAPLWGMARVARNEYPDRGIRLVDLGGDRADLDVLARAMCLAGEPEVVVRDGAPYVPRLVRVEAAESAAPAFDPDATVLITGGTGELGSQLATHLVREHGVR
ncbi:polyketide synthase dehydratase domain-containing protein, partial [Streptomyces sp. NPDC006355]|uniref:polyketide synthase dehydratase domain-containing protein n=1 Tax=Streptomyces sp. NPDC006355 TaxID=3156758 RepID=UPI0033B12FA0